MGILRSLVSPEQSAATMPERTISALSTCRMLAGTRGVTGPWAARRTMNRCQTDSPARKPFQELARAAPATSLGQMVAALGGTHDQSPALPASA